MSKSKIELVKDIISTCPYFENGKIIVDYAGDEIDSYSIDLTQSNLVYKQYADGSSLKQMTFDFIVGGSFTNLQNLSNSKFFEDFNKWIETQNKSNDLLNISGIDSIKCTTIGHILQKTETIANYIIQMQIVYYEGGN